MGGERGGRERRVERGGRERGREGGGQGKASGRCVRFTYDANSCSKHWQQPRGFSALWQQQTRCVKETSLRGGKGEGGHAPRHLCLPDTVMVVCKHRDMSAAD